MRQSVLTLKDLATKAGQMISHNPEQYGECLLNGVNTDLESFLSRIPDELHEYYEKIYIIKTGEWLSALSRCFSSAITGAANFNMSRHEKTERAEENARKRLFEWSERVIKRVNVKHRLTGWQEVERLSDKLERMKELQQKMKDANKIVRSKKLSADEQADELAALGFKPTVIGWLMKDPVYSFQKKGFQPYEISNNLAKIKTTENAIKRHTSMAQSEDKYYTFEGGEARLNYGEERIMIFFDAKPSEDVISTLKANAFRWSPNNMAWQRQLTDEAIYAFSHRLQLQGLKEKSDEE